jgi:pimeloyl-ACP methyl ester carboxylesterase
MASRSVSLRNLCAATAANVRMPSVDQFNYCFDNLAEVIGKFTEQVGLQKYSLYVMDYGAPIGYRLATKYPDRIQAIVVQNGNAYDEGLDNEFWQPIKEYWKEKTSEREQPLLSTFTREATVWQYTEGVRDKEAISPDNWNVDQPLLDRPGNAASNGLFFIATGAIRRFTPNGRPSSATTSRRP